MFAKAAPPIPRRGSYAAAFAACHISVGRYGGWPAFVGGLRSGPRAHGGAARRRLEFGGRTAGCPGGWISC